MQPGGVEIHPGALSPAAQLEMLTTVRKIVASAPLYQPVTARGQKMSVRISAAGAFGWVSDGAGYRYESVHPVTGQPWPVIPESILALWRRYAGAGARSPECCLINFYG